MMVSIGLPFMPPLSLISSTAINVPRNWVSSMTDMKPVLENSTPTRHGSDVRWLWFKAPIIPLRSFLFFADRLLGREVWRFVAVA
jgi:hypothetical protein